MTVERRCHACGRPVGETTHRRTDYAVDGFVLHTGPTEEAVFRRQADEAGVAYHRLLTPVVLVTCVDCFGDDRLRRRHRSWTYPAD